MGLYRGIDKVMHENLALMVPSRGRPENVERLCVALQETDSIADLYVGVDADDSDLNEYKNIEHRFRDINLIISNKRQRFAATVNSLSKLLCNDYKYLGWQGDDHVPRTIHWDRHYVYELERMQVGVVYGDDLVMGEAIATELAFTSNIVKTLGYAIPEGFVHLYVDNYFMELGRSIDRLKYLPDVVIQHMHPCVGKAEEDLTYREANSPENWTNDRMRFEKYILEELARDAAKLRDLL